MDIFLTPAAIKEIKRIIEAEEFDDAVKLRLAVRGGGCSGFEWKLDLDSLVHDSDYQTEQDGIPIVVDRRSILYVDGTIVDYYHDEHKKGFMCSNDRIKASCGCGSAVL